MTRWILALPLVWHLSGVAGMATVLCAPAAVPITCCCHHQATEAQEGTPAPAATVDMGCPCKMQRRAPVDPGTPTSATVASPDLRVGPAVAVAATWNVAPLAEPLGHSGDRAAVDTSPPYLTAAPPRC